MRTLIEMSLEHYNGLLAKCAGSDREYAIMKNAIVMPDSEGGEARRVAILCESDQAKKILDLASQFYPEAVPHIQEFTALRSEE
jgi:hypothetical protein